MKMTNFRILQNVEVVEYDDYGGAENDGHEIAGHEIDGPSSS